MDDFRATLTAGKMTRERSNLGRAGSEGGHTFPSREDALIAWTPPPSKEDVKQRMKKDNGKMNFVRNASGEFRSEGRLNPKVLDQWSQQRLVQPDRTHKKAPSGPKFKSTV